jgi:hypothetical protein
MLDELQLTYTSYNGQNLNSPAVSVIRGSTVLLYPVVTRHQLKSVLAFSRMNAVFFYMPRISAREPALLAGSSLTSPVNDEN